MVVGAHPYFRAAFADEDSYSEFRREFSVWQRDGEDSSYIFGRDTAYRAPKVNGQMLLRHVHLAPLEDPEALKIWDKAWENRRERKSDKALVYICRGEGKQRKCLFIALLPQGHAHEIANMTTPDDCAVMEGFARIAEHFIDTGKILVEP